MTIKKTRELLGEKVVHFSDKELLQFITETDKLLDALMGMAIKSDNPLHQNKKNDIT